ncbi:type II secretion system protein [Photobacterium rosenbergii]|uniref:type II secretion system protein n=1 Tax=Photobacterium rosenbergii TaxID=294936 RepID=UPI001C9A2A96|nr:type II secretion system protein [Photobacterium rosenbergii]MBY5943991.1 type II secretion system GspH family protein [Photobacterium rosenbergii]
MKKNGFTLIELVVVIVILGILAVTAAPRFLNLQVDARNSALEGLKGAVESGLEIGYGKMAMDGLESNSYVTNVTNADKGHIAVNISIPGCEISTNKRRICIFRFGYPESDFYTITTLVDGINRHYNQDRDWGITKKKDARELIITDKSNLDYDVIPPRLINDNCYLQYNYPDDEKAGYKLEAVACL